MARKDKNADIVSLKMRLLRQTRHDLVRLKRHLIAGCNQSFYPRSRLSRLSLGGKKRTNQTVDT